MTTDHKIQELQKCKEDIVYFAEKYCKVQNYNTGKSTNIQLNDFQKTFLEDSKNNDLVSSLSERRKGATTVLLIKLLWDIIFTEDKKAYHVSYRYNCIDYSKEQLMNMFNLLPIWMRLEIDIIQKTKIVFENNFELNFVASTSYGMCGIRPDNVYLDQSYYMDNDFKLSLFPIISWTGSQLVEVSTVEY